MDFKELEKIGLLLYGKNWRLSLAHDLNAGKWGSTNWKKQGVPKWVQAKLKDIAAKRLIEVKTVVREIEKCK